MGNRDDFGRCFAGVWCKTHSEIAQSLGKGITEFKRGVKDVQTEIENNVNTDPPPEQQPAQTTQTTQTTSGTETKS